MSQSSKAAASASLALACLVTAGLGAGCEDAAAKQRSEAQRTITTASAEFSRVISGSVSFGDEHFDSRQRELNGIVSRVGNLQNVEPGQQAAAALLAAEALSELASMHLAHAHDIERQHRRDRRHIKSMTDAAARLGGWADAHAALSTSTERENLQRERAALEEGMRAMEQRIAALESPIADRTRSNTDGEAEADRLRARANDLLGRAIELGHANGFPSFQEAIDARRDADSIDYDIALRELELDYELHPEHNLAKLQVEHMQSSVESLRQTLEEFDRFEQVFASDISDTRRRLQTFQQDISGAMQELNESISANLSEQYELADGHLTRAASQARQAVSRLRGEQANGARLAQARVHEAQGQMYRSQAAAKAEHIDLLSQLIEAGDSVGDTAAYQSTADELRSAKAQLIEEARNALSEAEQALSGITGRGTEAVEPFRRNLQQTVSELGGAGSRD